MLVSDILAVIIIAVYITTILFIPIRAMVIAQKLNVLKVMIWIMNTAAADVLRRRIHFVPLILLQRVWKVDCVFATESWNLSARKALISTIRCEFKKQPECPDYTRLWKYGDPDFCVGKHDPECPKGAWLDNCTCSLRIVRVCGKGSCLSSDGCSCVEEAEPECDDHDGKECQLNKKRCRCERQQDGETYIISKCS